MNDSFQDWIDGQVPITHIIPFNFGHNHYYAWISYIVVLCLGVGLNAMSLILMFTHKKILNHTATVYLSYLTGQDFFASLVCLIQCVVNLHHSMILGEKIACIIEAWQVCFFVGISGFSVCLYGFYLRERTLTANTKYVKNLDSKGLFKLHITAWSIYVVLATGATYWPGKSRLLSSGTYCMPALEDPVSSVFFFGLIILPCAIFLVVNYFTIYSNIAALRKEIANDPGSARKSTSQQNISTTNKSVSQSELNIVRTNGSKTDLESARKSRKQKESEQNTNQKMLTQFLCFVIVYCVFYLPFLLATCYEWITGYHASVYFDFIAGVLTHMVSVMNPIMYVLTTKKVRQGFVKIITSQRSRSRNISQSDIIKPPGNSYNSSNGTKSELNISTP